MNKKFLFENSPDSIDTFVILNPVNRFYLTGMQTSAGCVIISKNNNRHGSNESLAIQPLHYSSFPPRVPRHVYLK
jgi:hypothetical protein